ncbi:MAG: zinc-binding dehydrogenase [Gammaproteobacteria bacterium]|nr:zinc-binding dehydrogenase [Gammaproteobacteria bacterium]
MKAAILVGPKEFRVDDIDEPKVSDDGFVIRVKSVGVCGTDIHEYNQGHGQRGHEYSGEVVEVGPNAKGVKVGDRVAGRGGPAFAEYMAVSRGLHDTVTSGAVLLPEDMSHELACMIEPVSCGLNAVELAQPGPDDVVVVLGGGMLGQAVWQSMRARGAGKIIVSEIGTRRLDVTRSLGADVVVKADEEDLVSVINGITGGNGADIVADCVGSEATFQTAVDIAKGGGFWQAIRRRGAPTTELGAKIVMVGLGGNTRIPTEQVIIKGLTIIGSICGELTAARDLMADGKIDMTPLITHEYSLTEINDALNMASNPHDALKVLVKPGEE